MAIRYCSFAIRGYRLRQRMQMISLRLAEPSVGVSCWNLDRLVRAGKGRLPALASVTNRSGMPWAKIEKAPGKPALGEVIS